MVVISCDLFQSVQVSFVCDTMIFRISEVIYLTVDLVFN